MNPPPSDIGSAPADGIGPTQAPAAGAPEATQQTPPGDAPGGGADTPASALIDNRPNTADPTVEASATNAAGQPPDPRVFREEVR